MPNALKLVGMTFGDLTVLRQVKIRDRFGNILWRCKCSCGRIRNYIGHSLKSGNSSSCGHHFVYGTHFKTGTPEHKAWKQAKERCYNINSIKYKDYGGRGITMSPLWVNDFQAFYDHIGPRPSNQHSLDRIDNNGNYEPGNVRWATHTEQMNNRRMTKQKK